MILYIVLVTYLILRKILFIISRYYFLIIHLFVRVAEYAVPVSGSCFQALQNDLF